MIYEYDDNEFPLAYLITLRTYGTWLHGDKRLSIDRHGFNIYGTPRISPNSEMETRARNRLKHSPVVFNGDQRDVVESALKNVCEHRGYELRAINVRTNHLHAVVSAKINPKLIADAFKSYATRELRNSRQISSETKVWSRGRSRRYLWKPYHVSLAVEYVLYGQGDIIPEIVDCPEFND